MSGQFTGTVQLLSGKFAVVEKSHEFIQTLVVAECLSFRYAANALGVSQSSVSARVKPREEDLGVLFERHARGVRLTEAISSSG